MGNVMLQAPPPPAPATYKNKENGEPLSERNFRKLISYIYDYCGIRITPKKQTMIDGRLRRRMRVLDIDNINDYCSFLFDCSSAAAEAEIVHFINAVTTNKTDFFREPAHFAYMQKHLLAEFQRDGRRQIKVWSAASSTGAEAYTLAMVIDDFCHHAGGIDYSILGTDICTDVLGKGIAGIFPDVMIDPIPEEFRRRYVLVPNDNQRREFRISPHLRSKVAFSQLNLMADHYPFDRNFDMIFLRNVLIYFDRQTQADVLTRLCDHIRPGGYLFLGHSESITGVKLPLDTVANTIFRRR
jgi:chemotaxis protein methyltransferase CheR